MDKELIIKTIQQAIHSARINKNVDPDILYNCIYSSIELMIVHLCQRNNIAAGRIGIGFLPEKLIKIKVWIMPKYCGYFSAVFGTTAELNSNEEVLVNEEMIKEPEYEHR